MKTILALIIFCLPVLSLGQDEHLAAPDGYFTAIIVEDIDLSIAWYARFLKLELTDQMESAERGFKIANLISDHTHIELIELNSALSAKDQIANFDSKTRLKGIFKFGFRVADFDSWMTHLTALDAQFQGKVVQDPNTGKLMILLLDPDGNRIQLFEK